MGVTSLFLILLTLVSLCHNFHVGDCARYIVVVEPKSTYQLQSSSFSSPINDDQLALRISKSDVASGTYVVTVGLGTPTKDVNLMVDTGSATTWVQCGEGSIYDPSISNTSSTSSSCIFNLTYLDGGYSNGYTAKDKFTISNYQFPSIAFGCAHQLDEKSAKLDGILALGRTADDVVPSLLSQTAQTYGNTFCYCLPTAASNSGFLLFGSQAIQTCQNAKPTQLVNVNDPAHSPMYFVNFIGITIGESSSSSSAEMAAIDSGTEISWLPQEVYGGVKAEFKRWMASYREAEKGADALDTCYQVDIAADDLEVPKMVVHFGDGLNVNLEKGAVVWEDKNQNGLVCLGFAAKKQESGVTIIGSHQHKGFNLLYDNQRNTLAIGPGSC
ncbi:Aspartyl protease family protein At5g10770 [Linum grandiflorum]